MSMAEDPTSNISPALGAAVPCYWCGQPSTHLCAACGHRICDSGKCAAFSAGSAGVRLVGSVGSTLTSAVGSLFGVKS